jgi:hypothetical protein
VRHRLQQRHEPLPLARELFQRFHIFLSEELGDGGPGRGGGEKDRREFLPKVPACAGGGETEGVKG